MADAACALALTFHSTQFDVVDRAGQPWLQAADIARALGYSRADKIGQIYDRHADEFTPAMTSTLKLRVKGFGNGNSEKETRIFSLRGAHLLAMFARTPIAKEFRRWVLDVLDREVAKQRCVTKSQASTVNELVDELARDVEEPNSYPALMFMPLVEAVLRKLGKRVVVVKPGQTLVDSERLAALGSDMDTLRSRIEGICRSATESLPPWRAETSVN